MDIWNSPPSVGLDKRKEYVLSKMKEGYLLLVSPRRVRLFKRGVGYIPCAVQIFRKLENEKLLEFLEEDGEDKVYKLSANVKIRAEKKPKRVIEEDDDAFGVLEEVIPELDTTLTDLDDALEEDDELDEELDEVLDEVDDDFEKEFLETDSFTDEEEELLEDDDDDDGDEDDEL